MRVWAFGNQKGGVGKTTVVLNTAAAAAKTQRVLVIDMDPQATISDACGWIAADHDATGTIAESLKAGTSIEKAIRHSDGYGFDVALGHLDVRDLERSWQLGDQWALRERLDEIADRYDLVLIDSPPLLGFAQTLILFAADDWVLVADPRWAGTRAASKLADELDRAAKNGAPFRRAGLILNFVERTESVEAGIAELEQSGRFGPVWPVRIPKGTVLDDAMAAGVPLERFGHRKRAMVFSRIFDEIAEAMR